MEEYDWNIRLLRLINKINLLQSMTEKRHFLYKTHETKTTISY